MTAEERFARIEHVTAALVEERRKDREEYKALWRDTQKQMEKLSSGMVELQHHVDELAVETRLRIQELGDRLEQQAAESRAADERLGNRIEGLASAVGELIRGMRPSRPE